MEALGINYIWILAYVAIYGVLFYFASKFVKKVLSTVGERQKLIEDGLKNAKEVESLKAEQLKEIDVEKQKVLQEAYKQAQTIIDTAKGKEVKIVEEANKKAETIVTDAQSELDSLKDKSKQEGLKDAKEVIALVVRKAFEGLTIDKKTEEELISKSLDHLKK
jgi:F0F1-type ATP synthase membrane subunit b/b'